MIKCRPNSSSNRIRQTQLRANVSEKPGRKTATERFIEHFYGIVIWIPARCPKFHHANGALIHIFFGNQIIAGLCLMEFDFWLLKRRAFWPGAECLPKFSFHLRRIEIPRDAQNDVVGVNMRMMPVDQILASDRGNRCVLRNTRIRILRAVRQLGGIHVTAAFNFRRPDFQIIIELIASLSFRSSGAPHFAVNFNQTDFIRRLRPYAAANAGDAVNQWQFVIFLKKDHHPVRQLDAFGLLRMKRRQRWNLDLLPFGSLRGCAANHRNQKDEQDYRCPLHCSPPLCACVAGGVVSMIPTVRLAGTNVCVATFRMSAFVTLSMRSTERNSSRQSSYRAWYIAS